MASKSAPIFTPWDYRFLPADMQAQIQARADAHYTYAAVLWRECVRAVAHEPFEPGDIGDNLERVLQLRTATAFLSIPQLVVDEPLVKACRDEEDDAV